MVAIVSSFGSKCHSGAPYGSYRKICRDPKRYLRYDETRYLRYDEITDVNQAYLMLCNALAPLWARVQPAPKR
eukprot:5820438-Pleurochrysis_carterae.AAC.1